MDTIERIKNYLEKGGSAKEAVALLRAINHSETEVKELSAFERSFLPAKFERRVDELLNYYLHRNAQENNSTNNETPTETVTEKTNAVPDVIAALQQELKLMYKSRADYHTQMRVAVKQDQRAYCASEILKLTEEISIKYLLLDNYNIHGILPPQAAMNIKNESTEKEMAQLFRKINSLAPRISRLKKMLLYNNTAERISAITNEIKEKENALKTIRAQIDFTKKKKF